MNERLDHYFNLLKSNKITDRKAAYEYLRHCISDETTIIYLNNREKWEQVLNYIQISFTKDIEKGTKTIIGQIFRIFVRVLVKKANIHTEKVMIFIVNSLKNSQMPQFYAVDFLKALNDYILTDSLIVGFLTMNLWEELFSVLKSLLVDRKKFSENLAFDLLESLLSVVKLGPLYSLPVTFLRNQFDFFTKLGRQLNKSYSKPQQVLIVKNLLEFCRSTAPDNRVNCCKLGETVFLDLIDLYDIISNNDDELKITIIDFFLLQTIIHHPVGTLQNQTSSYAYSWTIWQKCLGKLKEILIKQVNYFVNMKNKKSKFSHNRNENLNLLQNFIDLFIEVSKQNFYYNSLIEESLGQNPTKKPKISTENFLVFLNNIQETKSWVWVHLSSSLLEIYPNIISNEDYLHFLQILTNLLIDCKDLELRNYLYKAFLIIERKFIFDENSNESWNIIAGSILRSIGLNETEISQKLLQKLIVRNLIKCDSLIQIYHLGDINLTENNFHTINTIFQHFEFLQSNKQVKHNLLKWILNLNNSPKIFINENLSKVLIFLTLKQWPSINFYETSERKKKFHEIEEIFLKSSLNDLISVETKTVGFHPEYFFNCDLDLFQTFVSLSTDFLNNFNEENCLDNFYLSIFLMNLISNLINYKLVNENELNTFILYNEFEKITLKLFKNLINLTKKLSNEIGERIKLLNILLKINTNKLMTWKVREKFPAELLKLLFNILIMNSKEEDNVKEEDNLCFFHLHLIIMETLINFCCNVNGSLLPIQEKALQDLSQSNYNLNEEFDYKMLQIFFQCLKICIMDSLPINIIINIFNLIHNICEKRYLCYFSSLEIIGVLYDFFQLIFPLESNPRILEMSKQILLIFFDKRLYYGPKISLALIKCMSLLCNLDPNSTVCNELTIYKITEFLTSPYQEVRFSAIQTVIHFFIKTAEVKNLDNYHRQEIVFLKISKKNLRIFEIEGKDFTEERVIDETLTRTSTVLQFYSALMVFSNVWIDESIFTLFKIMTEKKLENVPKILSLVAIRLNYENLLIFLEKYMEIVFEKWCYTKLNIDNFPFIFFKSCNKIEFFSKYWSKISHVILEFHYENLQEICEFAEKSMDIILEETFSKLLSFALCSEMSAELNVVSNNKIFKHLTDVFGLRKFKSLVIKNFSDILVNLINFLNDDNDFKKSFSEIVILPKFHFIQITIQQFKKCLKFIEENFCDGNNLFLTLIQSYPEKMYDILLKLNLKVFNSTITEEKVKYFYFYSVISRFTMENVENNENFLHFFLRDFIFTLLNLIKCNIKSLSLISCEFFKQILQVILPKQAVIFNNYFLVVITTLKNICLKENELSEICVDILEFLIIENSYYFSEEIAKLNEFPEKFSKLHKVHLKHNPSINLNNEMKQFLNFTSIIDNVDECEESLRNLHLNLIYYKLHMKDLYRNLKEVRVFSEDCENSVLHLLISTLVRMSCSTNENVSNEAVRCLGEIGPGNLASLVLLPEKKLIDAKWTSWELVSGVLISLLCKYLVDSDINLVKASSDALFHLLATREGRKVSESESDFGFGSINRHFLLVFLPHKECSLAFDSSVNDKLLLDVLDVKEISTINCHKTWITNLMCKILSAFSKQEYFTKLIKICKLKLEFCEQILPLMILAILQTTNRLKIVEKIYQFINDFFMKHWEITHVCDKNEKNIFTNRKTVKIMLNIVHFARLQKSTTMQKKCNRFNLDYLKIANGAEFCTAYFAAILYAEIWCQELIDGYDLPEKYGFFTLDIIYKKMNENEAKVLFKILRKSYKSVGESDALLGCGTSFLPNLQTRIEEYKNLGKWELVTRFYERSIVTNENAQLLMESLSNSNLYHSSLFCGNSFRELSYECLSHLSQWDFNENNQTNLKLHEKYTFFALKSLHNSDQFGLYNNLGKLRKIIIGNLIDINLESCQNFYQILTQIQSLKEIEDFHKFSQKDNLIELVNNWKIHDEIIDNDFQFIEPILTQRIIILNDYLKRFPNKDMKKYLIERILNFAEYARIEGFCNVTSQSLANLKLLSDLEENVKIKIKLEEAQLCWKMNDKIVAKCILRDLCSNANIDPRLHSLALKLMGKWLVEDHSENGQTIIEEYLLKSIQVLESSEHTTEIKKSFVDTYARLAKFADLEYQQVQQHIKSECFQKKIKNMDKVEKTVLKTENRRKLSADQQRALVVRKRQNKIDKNEIMNIENKKKRFLQFALKYYLYVLRFSDENNINIFRVVSLLLENRNNEVVKKFIKDEFRNIASYKFICILPQIIPHISNNSSASDEFLEAINEIVEKCAVDHPYHTLPLILSLVYANKDMEYSDIKTLNQNNLRSVCAKNLIKRIRPKKANLIAKMEDLFVALIELAYYKSHGRSKEIKIPSILKIKQIKNFNEIPVLILNLTIDKSLTYKNLIGIYKFHDGYFNVGGKNEPKRVFCYGTNGKKYNQLIKGQDDLRQDAVMQQVFTIMNDLLKINKQTSNLLIRTYKIIPLSKRSGVMEWVENSMMIGDYLAGDNGAHVKYRPNDMDPSQCRKEFSNAADKSPEEKLKVYKKICKRLRPVFHKFFIEQFPQPTVWYERRRAYTHSVATSSMCGYILGIGDRHLSNILIDKSRAEVIHIDFGIAFEQGQVLPTPETVPFRLTRDIVDGMGISGVEGVFKRAFEKTVEVLRKNSHTIITILEVLLYDPLYDWTVSTAEANKRQRYDDNSHMSDEESLENNSEGVNVSAERALLRLRAKLQGTETDGNSLSVENQVATLLHEAMNSLNLCQLYHGWQPYL